MYKSLEDTTAERLDRIAAALADLTAKVEQEKADHGKHNWAAAGSLGAVAEQLETINKFWN